MSTIRVTQERPAPPDVRASAGSGPGSTVSTTGTSRGEAPVPDRSTADVPVFDPEAARALAQQVQRALDRATPPPHQVVFRRDDTTNGFVIEVRNPDGSLVRQYPPEKLLNLRRKLDELSGMVIDEMT